MPRAQLPARFITFYSYKGGTGRSMALANMAWLLACAGRRVLVIDWDLEAPGLHRYFHPFLSDPDLSDSEGVIEFVSRFVDEVSARSKTEELPKDWFHPYANLLEYANSIDYSFPDGGALDFVPAGRQDPHYAERVNSFNWRHLYEKLGGWSFIDAMRERLVDEYDFVLIDSRTGVSDTAGVCTVQLPDDVVIGFTLNFQSVDGASSAARSILEQRVARNAPVNVYPVPMRVEVTAEKVKREIVAAYARSRFLPLVNDARIPAGGARERYWDEVEVPHISFYAFEEQLAWFLDTASQVTGVLGSVKRLARYVTGITEIEHLPGPERAERAEILRRYSAVWSTDGDTPSVPMQAARPPVTAPQPPAFKAASRRQPRGSLTVRVFDARRQPLDDTIDVQLESTSGGRIIASAKRVQGDKAIRFEALAEGQPYVIRIFPQRYRPVVQFVMLNPDTPAAVDIYTPIDPQRVTDPRFPPYFTLPQACTRVLEQSQLEGIDGSGQRLYDALDNLQKAGLLNLFAKMNAVGFSDSQTIWTFVERLTRIRGDRVIADVQLPLRDLVKEGSASDRFREVPGSLHVPPTGFLFAGSYKTPESYANLLLTFFMSSQQTDRLRLDAEIDLEAGLGHAFQVVRNSVTSGTNHPYDVHEVLVFRQDAVPPYDLA